MPKISGKQKKMKKESTDPPQPRARNFDKDEVDIIMREAGKHSYVLKGRFNQSVTSEAKQKTWEGITDTVNSVNGVGDRAWQNVRKKWQDTMSSAREKMRHNDHDRRRTGGGPSTAESLSSVERIAMESIAPVTVFGIDGGFDSNDPGYSVNYGEAAQSSSGVNNVSVSAILAENSEILGESLSEDSQISFNLDQPIVQPAAVHHTSSPTSSLDVHHRPRSTSSSFFPSGSSDDDSSLPLAADPAPPTPGPRIVTGILRPQPRILFPQPRGPALQTPFRRPFLQPRQIRAQPRQPGPRAPSPLVSANIPRLQSNRTVTRDIRKDEFKQLLKQHELTNKYLQQLVELKRRKYEFEYGIDIMAPMDSTDSDN